MVEVLGLTIHSSLGRDSQVDHMLTTANRKLLALRRLKKFRVQDPELVSMYTHYIGPVLEYTAPIWHSSLTVDQVKSLERMQTLACKIILVKKYSEYPEALCTL